MYKDNPIIDKTQETKHIPNENEVNDYIQKIEALNRQLNEFVYIVSHDLKAPLRGIVSLTVFIEDEIGSDIRPQVKELLGVLRTRTARMQSLIDAVLHYSRVSNSNTEKQPIDLKYLINNIIDL